MEGGGDRGNLSSGDFHDIGITYRSLQTLFRGIANRGNSYKYEVRLTVLELYNETWADLLEGATIGSEVTESEQSIDGIGSNGGIDEDEEAEVSDNTATAAASVLSSKLHVRKGVQGHYVEGASRRIVTSVGEVLQLLEHAYRKRHSESTALNETSSRSHLVLIVDVIGVNIATQVTSFGRLSLVDLAGSERVSRSGVTGARLVEATHINKSLSALSDVFTALADSKSKHIPFRNSKLTMLLQDSFVGNSRTLMFVNISPASIHAGETLCSLQFASRAKTIKLTGSNGPTLDGWGAKYKSLMTQQQAAFATREKTYATQFKTLKLQIKNKTNALEVNQIELKNIQEKLTETMRALDRSESDRLKALAAALPGASVKDRRLEASEDRKFDRLQTDLTNAQIKVTEAKAALEKVSNEWKDKYAALEAQFKESNEKLRVARLEIKGIKPSSTFGGGTSTNANDSNTDSNASAAEMAASEIASLTRKVALLELEVKRLKLVNRSVSNSNLRSPTKSSAPTSASNSRIGTLNSNFSLSVATIGLEEEEEAGLNEQTPHSSNTNASTPSASSSIRLSSAGPAGSPNSNSGIRPPSGLIRPASASATTSGALTAAKHAALLAQKRAQEAQSKAASGNDNDTPTTSTAVPYKVGSILAQRKSLLPPPSNKFVASTSSANAVASGTAAAAAIPSITRDVRSPSFESNIDESEIASSPRSDVESDISVPSSRRNSVIRKPRLPTATIGTTTSSVRTTATTSASNGIAPPKSQRVSLSSGVSKLIAPSPIVTSTSTAASKSSLPIRVSARTSTSQIPTPISRT
jgi:hypothetical protein